MFKSNMDLTLSKEKVRYIWGKSVIRSLPKDIVKRLGNGKVVDNSKIIENKIKVVKNNLDILYILDWVKFIGISGSVAAGFAKEEDDIDIYIVVKNGCAWIYRGILTIRNIFNHVVRTSIDGDSVKDLLCINFIVEERGLELESDMFNFHELMYLIPVYNQKFLKNIYRKNMWLSSVYGVNRDLMSKRTLKDSNTNVFLKLINICAFFAQLLFMLLTGHSPDIKRLFSNYRKGRIEFFPSDYKKKILEEFSSFH